MKEKLGVAREQLERDRWGWWQGEDGPQGAPSRCHIPWRARPCELCLSPKQGYSPNLGV